MERLKAWVLWSEGKKLCEWEKITMNFWDDVVYMYYQIVLGGTVFSYLLIKEVGWG